MGLAVYDYQSIGSEIVETDSTEEYTHCNETSSFDMKTPQETSASYITACGDNIKNRNEMYTISKSSYNNSKISSGESTCSYTSTMTSQRALEKQIVIKTIGRGRLFLRNSTATS